MTNVNGLRNGESCVKKQNRINLNAYLFANLLILSLLLAGLWNRKPVWDVSLRFPNLLLILVILNTILIFREVILGAGVKKTGKAPAKSVKSLRTLRKMLKSAKSHDQELLANAIAQLRKLSGSSFAAVIALDNGQSKMLATAGEIPGALESSKLLIKDNQTLIRFPGNLGDEVVASDMGYEPVIFRSVITRLEFVALPLNLPGGKTGLFLSAYEPDSQVTLPMTSTALFLETLFSLIEKSENSSAVTGMKEFDLVKHQYFSEAFDIELERSERYQQEMSLLNLKLCDFAALEPEQVQLTRKAVSTALKLSLRRLDLMFCGKNEESFIAILTETDVNSAELVGKRIQKSFAKLMEKHDFYTEADKKLIIGSATYPGDATHAQGLYDKSLEALERAMESGEAYVPYRHGSENTQETKNEN